jgi:hypothetical protein
MFIIYVLLSLQAINALIPVIIIVMLIAAAGGLARGKSFFALLGFGTIAGSTAGMKGGLSKRAYKSKYTTGPGAAATRAAGTMVGKKVFNKNTVSRVKGIFTTGKFSKFGQAKAMAEKNEAVKRLLTSPEKVISTREVNYVMSGGTAVSRKGGAVGSALPGIAGWAVSPNEAAKILQKGKAINEKVPQYKQQQAELKKGIEKSELQKAAVVKSTFEGNLTKDIHVIKIKKSLSARMTVPLINYIATPAINKLSKAPLLRKAPLLNRIAKKPIPKITSNKDEYLLIKRTRPMGRKDKDAMLNKVNENIKGLKSQAKAGKEAMLYSYIAAADLTGKLKFGKKDWKKMVKNKMKEVSKENFYENKLQSEYKAEIKKNYKVDDATAQTWAKARLAKEKYGAIGVIASIPELARSYKKMSVEAFAKDTQRRKQVGNEQVEKENAQKMLNTLRRNSYISENAKLSKEEELKKIKEAHPWLQKKFIEHFQDVASGKKPATPINPLYMLQASMKKGGLNRPDYFPNKEVKTSNKSIPPAPIPKNQAKNLPPHPLPPSEEQKDKERKIREMLQLLKKIKGSKKGNNK